MLIEVKNLHKSFGENQVLRGIDVSIQKGEVVVVIGPSGSGKSTFLRCLNLLEQPTDGQVIFDGVDLTDGHVNTLETCRRMGMVFQRFNLFSNLTILDNVTLAPIFDNCYFICIKTFLIRYNFEQVSKFKFAPLNSPQLLVK